MQTFPNSLLTGYRNFMDGRYVDERERYRRLAENGQTPQTLVIACCDSRAAPETIFDSRPGELFVIRNVANMMPPYEPDGHYHSTSAALASPLQALPPKDTALMGPAPRARIKAALDPAAEPLSPGDFIGRWMNLLKPAAEQIQNNDAMTASERQTALERISIRNSIKNLRTFPCVRILEERGKLKIHGAWFDIGNGELWVMDSETGDFRRPDLSEIVEEEPAAPAA